MLTLTMPIGPDLVAALAASAAAAGLPVDEHAENLLRGALGLPGYAREQAVENICRTPDPRIEELNSALEKALRQELAQSQRQLQRLKEALRQQVVILDVHIPKLFGPSSSVAIADEALALLRQLSLP